MIVYSGHQSRPVRIAYTESMYYNMTAPWCHLDNEIYLSPNSCCLGYCTVCQEATSITELEEALKRLKEMKTSNIKLTSLLKIGQEALKMEQDEVKRLKSLLIECHKVLADEVCRLL